jgi:predicted transcriptional regulator
MKTLTITVQPHDRFVAGALAEAKRVDAGAGYQGEVYSFENIELLFQTITARRWALIWKLREIGPSSLRGLARQLGRDVKRVHEDAAVLLEDGIIERDARGRLFVPYDDIKVEVSLADSVAA